MTSSDIRAAVCEWINDMGFLAIQSPANTPAPKGLHIAVSIQGVKPYGSFMKMGVKGHGRSHAMQYIATVQLYEVEGEGDVLRKIRTSLETSEFDDFIKGKFPEDENGDNHFAVWEIADIQDNSSQDGIYFIKQKTMTFEVQFNDFMENKTERMISVNGSINDKDFKVGVTNG